VSQVSENRPYYHATGTSTYLCLGTVCRVVWDMISLRSVHRVRSNRPCVPLFMFTIPEGNHYESVMSLMAISSIWFPRPFFTFLLFHALDSISDASLVCCVRLSWTATWASESRQSPLLTRPLTTTKYFLPLNSDHIETVDVECGGYFTALISSP